MPFSVSSKAVSSLGLVLAIAGCFALGALLSLFQVPGLLYGVVYLGLLYLVWLTTDALFISGCGLTLLLLVAVARRPWPLQWDAFSAWNQPQLWAMTLLGLWLAGALLLVMVAQTSRVWQRLGDRRFWRFALTLLYGGALGLGVAMEQL
jgi:hypothetical protein